MEFHGKLHVTIEKLSLLNDVEDDADKWEVQVRFFLNEEKKGKDKWKCAFKTKEAKIVDGQVALDFSKDLGVDGKFTQMKVKLVLDRKFKSHKDTTAVWDIPAGDNYSYAGTMDCNEGGKVALKISYTKEDGKIKDFSSTSDSD